MKIQLLVIGNTSAPFIKDGIEIYRKRLSHYVPFDIVVLPDIRNARNLTEEMQKQKEGMAMLDVIKPGDYVVLLDERGVEYTSREFAGFVDKRMATVSRTIWFVIGGPYGFSDAVYDRCDFKLSFSRMTFSHEMIRLFFTEQLYRAMTILRGEPYHHD